MSEGPGISNFMDSIMNEGRIFGVMVGIVINNDSTNHADKPGPGLVKVKIPLMGMPESTGRAWRPGWPGRSGERFACRRWRMRCW